MKEHDCGLFCSVSALAGDVIKRELACKTEDFALKGFDFICNLNLLLKNRNNHIRC